MIRYTIKVKNDQGRSLSEKYEATSLFLSSDDASLQEQVRNLIESFKEPIDQVIISAKMEL